MYPTDPTSPAMTTPQSPTMGDTVQTTVNQAQQQLGQVIGQVQQQAGQIAEKVQEQARTQLAAQKDDAGRALGGVAQVVRQVGDQMRQSGQAPLADYASQAATQLEQVANYLQRTTVESAFNDISNYARRQPGVFIAAGVVLGVLTARFIKSTAEQKS